MKNDKKENILKLLKKLFWFWGIAEEIYTIIYYSDNLSDEILDNIILNISISMKNVKEINKLKIYKLAIKKVENIKKEEFQENDLSELEKLLNNL